MKCLERFNKRMQRNGDSLRNEKIFNSRMLLKETFYDDPAFSPGMYFWSLGKLQKQDYEYDETIDIRIYDRTYSAANGHTVKFQTQYDTPVIVGDIIFDSGHEEYYICTESFDIDSIHYNGKLTLCNWILRWQKPTGEILEYPCYDINSTQYNSGETSNKQFTIGTAQHMITLPCDDNTVVLETPKRFFLDKNVLNPTPYIVTQNDSTSHNRGKKGLVKLTVMQTVRDNEKDNIELGICDYINPDEVEPDIGVLSSKIIYDTDIIKSGGNKQKFVGKFYDTDGSEITSLAPKWTIICDFLDRLEVEESGNEIWIGIDDPDCVDEEIKLVFSDENGNYPSTLIIRIDSLL